MTEQQLPVCICEPDDEFLKGDLADQLWWHRLDCPLAALFDAGYQRLSEVQQ